MSGVRVGPLWAVTLFLSFLLVAGAFVSYDHAAAKMFGVLGGVALPLVSGLHYLAGGQ